MFIPNVSSSRLTFLGRYESGIFDDDGAEIPTYDPTTERVFVINANAGVADVLDVSDPTDPSKVSDIDPGGDLPSEFTVGGVNSVDAYEGTAALAALAPALQYGDRPHRGHHDERPPADAPVRHRGPHDSAGDYRARGFASDHAHQKATRRRTGIILLTVRESTPPATTPLRTAWCSRHRNVFILHIFTSVLNEDEKSRNKRRGAPTMSTRSRRLDGYPPRCRV
jgi:hypothetical protein